MLIDFREEEGRKTERERNPYLVGCLLYVPQLGTKPTTQACTLTGNQAHKLPVYKTTLQTTEPHWPGFVRLLCC